MKDLLNNFHGGDNNGKQDLYQTSFIASTKPVLMLMGFGVQKHNISFVPASVW